MIIALVLLDPANADKEGVENLLQDGQLLYVEGWLNTRWGDFSALELVRSAKLDEMVDEVTWEVLTDDTAGTLELTILYPLLTEKQVEERVSEINGLEDYEFEVSLYDIREIVERHSATMD